MDIPGYQLGREIAVKKLYSVYNALDIDAQKTVSVRTYQPSLLQDKDFCDKFRQSLKTLIGKTYGNMVSIKNAQLGDSICYIVYDYFPCTQQQEVPPQLSDKQLLTFAQQLASTLTLLHTHGLVHGAIKTTNLHFSDGPQLKLGLPAFHNTLSSDTSDLIAEDAIERAQYLAPEATEGLTPSSDFYALGVVLYELIFHQKLFNAGSIKGLMKQKQNLEIQLPDAQYDYLYPLFEQLLTPDPDQRINDSDTFNQTLQKCGVSLDNIQYQMETTDEAAETETAKPEPKQKNPSNNIRLIAPILIGIVFIVVLVVLFTGDDENENVTPQTQSTAMVQSKDTPTQTTARQDKPEQTALLLFKQAQQAINKGSYGSALISINNALKENPTHQGALALKAEVEKELAVRAQIKKAEQQIDQGKLTKPPGDNAYETYLSLNKLIPASDSRVEKGLENIAANYSKLANKAYDEGNIDKANQYINSGIQILPDYAPLVELSQQITRQQNAAAQKAQLAQQQAAREQQQRQLQLKKQNELKKAQAERNRQQQQRQAELEEKKQLEISRQLKAAKSHLQIDRLSLKSIASSRNINRQLSQLAPKDHRIISLNDEIIDAYGILANSQKNAAEYNDALETLEQGLSMDADNNNLQAILAEVNNLITIEKEKQTQKPQIPIIGTF